VKAKVPGAHSSTGVKAQDFTLPKGDYVFEIGSAKVAESQKSPCMCHTFEMLVIDGPDDEKTGRSTQGRKFFRRVNVLEPEHPSYNPTDTRNADEIHDLCLAAGVDIDDDDAYETEDFGGQKVKAKLGLRMGKDENGEPRPENTVLSQKDEGGTLHLWLSDDGRSTSGASPAKKPSAPAAKKSPPAKKR
jgi:hypothetical protein